MNDRGTAPADASGGMTPGLAQMLGAQAPPATPMSDATPDVRKNPTHEWYVAMQKVQVCCKSALEKADEQDPAVKAFLASVQQTCLRLITVGTLAQPVIAAGLARAFDGFAPQISQQLDALAYSLSAQAAAPPQVPPPQAGPGGGALPQSGQMPPGPFGAPAGGPPVPAPGPGAVAVR